MEASAAVVNKLYSYSLQAEGIQCTMQTVSLSFLMSATMNLEMELKSHRQSLVAPNPFGVLALPLPWTRLVTMREGTCCLGNHTYLKDSAQVCTLE